jgi:cysteine desulfurase / selenocysteine lyase
MNWEPIYEAFPVNQNLIWLNNCGTTPAGAHVVEAVSRFIRGYSEKGIFTDTESYQNVKKNIKTILSGLLNCLPSELALIHNTAEGMNFISHGLPLGEKDEIILLENEYPSNVYPWRHWEKKGVKIRFAPMASSPEAFLESFKPLISHRTRVVALSAVHWCTGMPLPIEQIGSLCGKKNIQFVVDGAQGVGMQPINVKTANVSFMAFPAWKWLMGPLGLAVLYVSEDSLNLLNPVFVGTGSVINDEEYLPYKSDLKPTADRFTISTANFNDWVYFKSTLEYLQNIGFEKIRKRLFELTGHLNDGLRSIGWQVYADQFPDYPTAITACMKPEAATHRIMATLKAHQIVAAERLGRVRFSPHIYISFEQLDHVVRLLQSV